MSNDPTKARSFYEAGQQHIKATDTAEWDSSAQSLMEQCEEQIREALKRLGR